MELVRRLRMDKTQFATTRLDAPSDEPAYWATQTPHERLQAMELMRQICYGYNPVTDRLQRVFAVLKHPAR